MKLDQKTIHHSLLMTLFAALLTGCVTTPQQPPNLGLLKDEIKTYYADGSYEAEAKCVGAQAMKQLKKHIGQPQTAIVLDIDDTSLLTYKHMLATDFGYNPKAWNIWAAKAEAPAIEPTLALVQQAHQQGTAVFFITGRKEYLRSVTTQNLLNAGYSDWVELIMKPNNDKRTADAYKTAERKKITDAGYSIVVNMGDQLSDLSGGYAENTFKLPNPCYFIP